MRLSLPWIVLALVAALAAGGACAGTQRAAAADRAGELQSGIDSSREREQSLAAAAAKLGKLERATAGEVTLLEGRVAAAQSQLDRSTALVAATRQRLANAQRRAIRLRKRLGEVRAKLRAVLVSRYRGEKPDLVTVVL